VGQRRVLGEVNTRKACSANLGVLAMCVNTINSVHNRISLLISTLELDASYFGHCKMFLNVDLTDLE